MPEEIIIEESGLLKNLVDLSIAAVASFWDHDVKTFWRSSEHRDRDKPKTKAGETYLFPTVTFTCFEALSRFRGLFPDWPNSETDTAIKESRLAIVTLNVDDVKSSLPPYPDGTVSPFTLSYYVRALVDICNACRPGSTEHGTLVEKIAIGVDRLLADGKGAWMVERGGNGHPFVIFHVLLTFMAAKRSGAWKSDFNNRFDNCRQLMLRYIRDATSHLLARHSVGLLSPSDAVALAFCASVLSLSEDHADHHYILPSMKVCFDTQDASGCWPLGRVVAENKDIEGGRLEISTYEIAWALALTLLSCLRRSACDDNVALESAKEFTRRLLLTARYAKGSVIRINEPSAAVGWCTDHPYGKEIVESWTSANVLQLTLTLDDVMREVNRSAVLRTFSSVERPTDVDWPPWLRWDEYRTKYEPDSERPILDYLDRHIIKPVLADPRQQPSGEARNVSVLLFGLPGTQKTSIVKAVADGLQWPLVLLSPGDFIAEGLEYIEAQSSSLFKRLLSLSRAVVLFDECDELFRGRAPKEESEQMRGIAAFVTASMLPKLQTLHDRGRVVFFLCTNQYESMDKAVQRGGRVDHIIGVGPPDREARTRMIRDASAAVDVSMGETVVEELASSTERFTITELRRIVKVVAREMGGANDKDARNKARRLAEAMRDSLTIGPNEYDAFLKLKKQVSYSYREGRT